MEYQLIFEANCLKLEIMKLIPIIMMIIGIVLFNKTRKTQESQNRRITLIISAFVVVFCFIASVTLVVAQIIEYQKVVGSYKKGSYSVVEGVVENYYLTPYKGRTDESFNVNGVHFEYSENKSSLGYNNAASYGGVITQNGLQVRIGYVSFNSTNVIVKLEVVIQDN